MRRLGMCVPGRAQVLLLLWERQWDCQQPAIMALWAEQTCNPSPCVANGWDRKTGSDGQDVVVVFVWGGRDREDQGPGWTP